MKTGTAQIPPQLYESDTKGLLFLPRAKQHSGVSGACRLWISHRQLAGAGIGKY
jgi:hypothetical protein